MGEGFLGHKGLDKDIRFGECRVGKFSERLINLLWGHRNITPYVVGVAIVVWGACFRICLTLTTTDADYNMGIVILQVAVS